MKIIKIIIICFMIIIHGSCRDDFLNKSQHTTEQQDMANEKGIEELLIGAYGQLQGHFVFYWNSFSEWIYGDIYSDEAYKGSTDGDQPYIDDIERYKATVQNGYLSAQWTGIYQGVSCCNQVLSTVELALKNNTISNNQAEQYKAEALFLRGFYQLEAIKLWDFVPYLKENNTDGLVPNQPASNTISLDGNKPWSQLEEDGKIPWYQVENDLDSAIKYLPPSPRNGQKGRATKYAALGLLARVLLFEGKYSDALPILVDSIIQSGKFQLDPSFAHNFRINGDNNEESLFEIQAAVNDGSDNSFNGNWNDNMNFPYTWPNYDIPHYGACCGFYQPSQNLVNAFKTKNGLPYLEAFGLQFNAEGDDVKNDEGYATSDTFITDSRPLDPRLDWTVGRRGIPYIDWGLHPGKDLIRDQNFSGPYSPKKNVYTKAEVASGGTLSTWGETETALDHKLIRYADVLLMAAECEVEANNLTRARDLVNQVRARTKNGAWVLENGAEDDGSHVGPNGELPAANYQIEEYPTGGLNDPFQNQASAREAVRFERRLEFGMEGMRFWDLKRWGVAKTVLNNYLKKESKLRKYLAGVEFKDERIRHPIPQNSIDLSQGTLKQNPGY